MIPLASPGAGDVVHRFHVPANRLLLDDAACSSYTTRSCRIFRPDGKSRCAVAPMLLRVSQPTTRRRDMDFPISRAEARAHPYAARLKSRPHRDGTSRVSSSVQFSTTTICGGRVVIALATFLIIRKRLPSGETS